MKKITIAVCLLMMGANSVFANFYIKPEIGLASAPLDVEILADGELYTKDSETAAGLAIGLSTGYNLNFGKIIFTPEVSYTAYTNEMKYVTLFEEYDAVKNIKSLDLTAKIGYKMPTGVIYMGAGVSNMSYDLSPYPNFDLQSQSGKTNHFVIGAQTTNKNSNWLLGVEYKLNTFLEGEASSSAYDSDNNVVLLETTATGTLSKVSITGEYQF